MNGCHSLVHHVTEGSLTGVLGVEARPSFIQHAMEHEVCIEAVMNVPLHDPAEGTQHKYGAVISVVIHWFYLVYRTDLSRLP